MANALAPTDVQRQLKDLPGWSLKDNALQRTWQFKDHYQTMAFVNAVAWISHTTDHHPDMQVGYNKVTLAYTTHSAGGITDLDMNCAAAVSRLPQP